jgi:hypothetical protein
MAASVAEPARRQWYVAVLDAALAAIIVWNVVELGFYQGRAPWPAFLRQ